MTETKTTLTWLLRDEVSPAADKVRRKLGETEKAANTASGRFGRLGSAMSAIGPASLIAGGALGALVGVGVSLTDTYLKVEEQEKSLNAALVAHGTTLDANRDKMDAMVKIGEKYGQSADNTRAAVTKLAEAGVTMTDIEAGLPAVFNLAIAKNIDAASAADLLAKANMGSAKGLLDLGIKLPKAANASAELAKAQKNLATVEAQLAGKHKLTAAETLRLKEAHQALAKATADSKAKATGFLDITKLVTGATGDQSASVNGLQQKQAELGDKWEEFATRIGPMVTAALGAILDVLNSLVDVITAMFTSKPPAWWAEATQGRVNTGGRYGYVVPGHAAGGWVGLSGPELAVVGERGPEYVTPANRATSSGVTIQGISERDIINMVDRGMYFRLRRAGTGR